MIRYATIRGKPFSTQTIRDAILADEAGHLDPEVRKDVKDWQKKADDRTAQLIAIGEYLDLEKWNRLSAARKSLVAKPLSLSWSSIKYLFMELQNDKCAYCERKLAAASSKGGPGETDVDHFRPKNPVKKWPTPKRIGFATGDSADPGYYWLAFHLLNYCTACPTCNSGHKSNYFPILGTRIGPGHEPCPRADAIEQPLLIYPLGTTDEDPEDVIRFRGLAAEPPERDPLLMEADRSHVLRNRRAVVIIAFYQLNSRVELLWGRAERLRELEKALGDLNKGTSAEKLAAKADIQRLMCGFSEHTACIRAMVRLYRHDHATARLYFDAIRKYLDSKTPKDYRDHAGQFVQKPRSRN